MECIVVKCGFNRKNSKNNNKKKIEVKKKKFSGRGNEGRSVVELLCRWEWGRE
jgi:hypothetical protein